MSRLPVLVALVALAAGCGHASTPAHARVRVAITITRSSLTVPPNPVVHSYTLTCGPTGGTLPDAARLCADIARHPGPMLDPPRARGGCTGSPIDPVVSVTSGHGSFGGIAGCDWPGGAALALYEGAATHDERMLDDWEPVLRCDDDPALLVRPTPYRSVFACTHRLWTPRTAWLIALAERVPTIARIAPRFPRQIGARPCRRGLCEVNVTHVWGNAQVTFTESGPSGRRVWVVGVERGRARLERRSPGI